MDRRMLYWLPLKWRSSVIWSVLAFPRLDLSMELGFSVLVASQVEESYLLEEVHDRQHGKDVKVELPQQFPLDCLINNESRVINIT